MFGQQAGGGGGFGGFGQNNQQQQQQQQQPSGGFGANATGTGFGGFGQATQTQSTGFGSTGFGANTQPSGFGSTASMVDFVTSSILPKDFEFRVLSSKATKPAGGGENNKSPASLIDLSNETKMSFWSTRRGKLGVSSSSIREDLKSSNWASQSTNLDSNDSTGFGASTAGGFGQNKGFGSTPATTAGGLFGSNTATSGFGTGAAAGGFGAGATGGTGFGASTAGTGLFGSKPAPTGFGGASTGTGIFGSSTTANAGGFGGNQPAAGGFGAAAATNSNDLQPPAQGTATSPFTPFTEKDAASSMTNHFQTVSFMAPYAKWSLEELRLQDYLQGRTKASGPTGGFGANAGTGFGAFGQQQQQQQTAGGFGQQTSSAATGGGLFGTASNTGAGFGTGAAAGGFGASTTTGGGMFGQQKPAGTGIFGSSTTGTNPTTGTTGTGLFGAQNTAGTGFGTGATAGGFGQPAQTTGNGLFGAQQQQKPSGFGTGFGATATTGGGFGQQTTGSTLFGQQAASTATGTGGLFGTAQQTAGGFGQQPAGGAFGAGGFGAQAAQPQQPANTGFGAFGNQAQTPAKPAFGGGFGAASTTPAAATTGGGLFGQQQPAQQQAAAGGLFGNKGFGTAATPTAGGGLFGQQAQQPAQAGGLFGQQAAATGAPGGGLFGQQQQQQQQQQPGGLFGNQQKPGGLFGQPAQNATPGGGLFGAAGNAAQPQGSSFFGQPAQNAGSGFGQSSGGLFGSNPQPAQTGFGGGSLFQAAQQQQQQPQALTASIMDQRPYGNVPLLDISIGAGATPSLLATPLSGSTKKKAAMIPHSKIAPRQPALGPRVASPFSRSSLGTSSPMLGGSLGRTFSSSSSRVGLGGSVFDSPGASDDSILNTSAFTPGGNRTANLKRLVIDRNLRDPDLFVKEGEARAIKGAQDNSPAPESSIKKTVSFDAAARSQTASPAATGADLGYMRTPTRQSSAPVASPAPENALVPVASPAEAEAVDPEMEEIASSSMRSTGASEKKGDYWSVPSIEKLKSLPREKLASVPDLIVGRNNFGQIRFDQPVDLTEIHGGVEAILGGVIHFADRVCTVYPPGYEKPLPGNGLNVPATITLEDCFPTDREHKQPIRDPDHPRYQFHLRRLKNIKDTEFVDYLVQDGIWIFKVQHFTTYGLQDEDDDETDSRMEDSAYDDVTPTKGNVSSSVMEESSFASPGDITFEDDSIADDTFEFKRSKKTSAMRFIDETLSSDMIDPEEGSGESVEGSDLSEEEEDTTQILPQDDVSIVGEDDTHLTNIVEEYREATPEAKLGVGRDWTDQLSRTISPVKNRAPLGFRGPIASAKNPFADVSNVDFTESLFASRNRDFESPYRPAVRTFASPVVKRNKKPNAVSQYKRPEAFNKDVQESDDREWRQAIRPSWGPKGEIIHTGSIGISRPRGFGEIKASKTRKATLKFSVGSAPSSTALLSFQLAASEITQDSTNIPFAKLDPALEFSQFANVRFGTSPQQQHERSIWQLASILFDATDTKQFPESFHVRLHLRDKQRKLRLSKFFEQIVAQDVEKDQKAAQTAEASAFALLSGYKVEEAVENLITGSDFRLATLVPLIGGDKQARGDVKKQIQSWRTSGVLSEVPLAVRALYELLSGNVGYSEGVSAPMEDATPSFWLGEMFGLDWRRTFALRLWYEIYEDEELSVAVAKYEKAFSATDSQHVRHPEPWYQTEAKDLQEGEAPVYDTLWGLLKMYTDENYPLEKVILPRSYSQSLCDFRLAWQLRMMFSEKSIRDLAENVVTVAEDGSEVQVEADRLTVDFASQLEAEGEWHWAVFVLMHLSTPESRACTIKDLLAKHVEDLSSDKEQLDFILHKLLIPSAWVYEAKALQARFQQDHFEEVDCLLSASAWNEAHKTLLSHAAPLCVVNEDLEKLYDVITKFTDSTLVENWATGAQVYLDFIFLSTIAKNYRGFQPAIPKVKGLPKGNSKRDVAKRLMEALPKMDIREFLPGVAVREMSRILADFVLKSDDLGTEASRVLGLPLTEDQALYKELTIKASEGMVIG
ncbi:hypothetical protein H072_5319 [Dactylellina haptotyla CBS 200.50]|uniref:Peptidase S59 domain-containing protein n=1 Tax=Dactylellina haptotyla (strain CBS 200.50) TaxID=1284197 RepID=S8BZH2_DACHA|nr:hypothetical protein H072_5319 [Dactylellina haptotyla CBS 200.50]